MSSEAATFVIDTESLPPHERLAFLRDGLKDTIGSFEVEAAVGRPMRQIFKLYGGTGVRFFSVVSSPVSVLRRPGAGDDDLLSFNLPRNGSVLRHEQLGRSVEAATGQAYLDLMYEPMLFSSIDPHTADILSLSREKLSRRLVDVEAVAIDVRTDNPGAVALLNNYVDILKTTSGLDDAVGDLVSDHIHDLVALILRPAAQRKDRQPVGAGVRAARLASIKRYVAAHLTDPALNAKSISRRFDISDRYLRLIFEPDGGFWDYLSQERIALAARMLADPRFAGVKLLDIAFRCGFNSPSTFNRLFLKQMGCRPSSLRA